MVELSIFNIQIHFSCEIPQRHIGVYLLITLAVGPLRANPTKWSNTLKQFVGKKAPYQMFGRVLNKLEHHSQHFHTSVNLKLKTKSTKQNHMYKIFFISSELVSEMVRVLPKSTYQYFIDCGETAGSSRRSVTGPFCATGRINNCKYIIEKTI